MSIKIKLSSFTAFAILAYAPLALANEPVIPSFASAEHLSIGDQVALHLDANLPNQTSHAALHLSNGLTLTYGELVTLGDFYGVIGQAISQGQTEQARQGLFLTAFNEFAMKTENTAETMKLLSIIHEEEKMVATGIEAGRNPENIYADISGELNRQFNCATGGGCSSTWWLNPGRYLTLAETDYDHFGNNAWVAYTAGHQLALEAAAKAYQTQDQSQLEVAYAINAFAAHFLSDRFAAGHIRTPRLELAENVTPRLVGNLLVNYMHNEENLYGLHVHNANGNEWIAYGDRSYFTEKNKENRDMLANAMQLSADEVFSAYLTGVANTSDAVEKLIPIADEYNNRTKLDVSPLFFWEATSQTLMRRSDLAAYYDRNWTSSWWGWSTLAALQNLHGLPSIAQAALATSSHAQEAIKWGLIKDPAALKLAKQSHA